MSAGIVLHDLGAPDGGAPWRAALASAGWSGWTAPDLPGHGAVPAPRTGAYDPMAVVMLARGADPRVIVGVGENAHTGLVLAGAGECEAVVVVDGLHGAFGGAVAEVDALYARLRGIADDADAHGPPPATGRDPRTTHGYGVSVSARFLERFWAVITAPVLALETPSSPTPPGERDERLSWFTGPTTLVEVPDASPDVLLAEVGAFLGHV